VVAVRQNRPHDGLRDPVTPGKALTPNEKYAALVEAAPTTSPAFGSAPSPRRSDDRDLDPSARHTGPVRGHGLTAADTAELTKLLQFIIDWIDTDEAELTRSFNRFVDDHVIEIHHLRHDLHRYAALLSGTTSKTLLEPDQI